MSRIGRIPVKIPNGVTVTVNDSKLTVSGLKGTLSMDLRPEVGIKVTAGQGDAGSEALVEIAKPGRLASAYMGMTRSLLNSMVKGVSEGFEKKLELVGVGYRAKMNDAHTLGLTLGFSHPIEFKLPEGIQAQVDENQTVVIKGADKYLVGQVAANIRKIRKPEPYKGKGIKYSGEFIRRKQGKSGKV